MAICLGETQITYQQLSIDQDLCGIDRPSKILLTAQILIIMLNGVTHRLTKASVENCYCTISQSHKDSSFHMSVTRKEHFKIYFPIFSCRLTCMCDSRIKFSSHDYTNKMVSDLLPRVLALCSTCFFFLPKNLIPTLYSHYAENGVLQFDGMETLPPSCHRRMDIET